MQLSIVEAGRTVLLRRIGPVNGTAGHGPLARWALSPWRTWSLWWRMALGEVTGYRQAADSELELRHAISLLRLRYGRR